MITSASNPLVRRLRDRRIALGLTQREFARLVSTQQSHVCDVERGRSSLRLETAQRWAFALGLEVQLVERRQDGGR